MTNLRCSGRRRLRLLFLILEALLGAATVLLGLTGDNATVGRGLLVATHLVNSVLLIGALTATLIYARPNASRRAEAAGSGLSRRDTFGRSGRDVAAHL